MTALSKYLQQTQTRLFFLKSLLLDETVVEVFGFFHTELGVAKE